MKHFGLSARIAVLATATLFATGETALAADRTETVKFAAGASNATVKGAIKGYDGIAYKLGASAGQVMQVLFSPSNGACYFNVFAPGNSSEAVFNGSMTGNEYSANLKKSGNYTVQVYMMRSAARRNETCRYTISFEITG